MVVKAHGGPTASSGAGLQMDVQFWTSRGFAYVDINYRGSTGLGRAYRQSLQGRWGELDIDDVVDVVQHLAQTGRADPKSIFIRGGSAGGYTVLRVLTRDPEIWAGGMWSTDLDLKIGSVELNAPNWPRIWAQLFGCTHMDPRTRGHLARAMAWPRLRGRWPKRPKNAEGLL